MMALLKAMRDFNVVSTGDTVSSAAKRNVTAFLTLLCVGSSLPAPALAGSIPDLTLEQLTDQVGRPFEEKFAYITNNISETSRQNIQALQARLNAQRSFAQYLTPAKALVTEFKRGQAISHTLPAVYAIADLGFGAVYSLDELARQKIIDPRYKNFSASRAITDGRIGEQDVVFLSLRDSQPPAANEFGEVTFIFKNQVLEQGFFSPFAYSMGLRAFEDPRLSEDYLALNRINADIYRQFIFSGRAALDDFLLMSFAQNERFQERYAKNFQKKLKPFFGDVDYIRDHLPECMVIANELARALKQLPVNDNFDANACRELVLFTFGHVNPTFSAISADGERSYTTKFREIYGAYRGFPSPASSEFAVTRTSPSDFIELKIPTKVDLSLMKAILIPKFVFDRRTNTNHAFDAEPVITAIKAYADRTSRPFKVIDRETSIEYRF